MDVVPIVPCHLTQGHIVFCEDLCEVFTYTSPGP
jgi:hypothetical protein